MLDRKHHFFNQDGENFGAVHLFSNLNSQLNHDVLKRGHCSLVTFEEQQQGPLPSIPP